MIVTTSICANYVPKARTLAKSVKKHHPEAKFVLSLVEKEIPDWLKNDDLFDQILLSTDLDIPQFDGFMFKYTIVEAATAVKGHLMLKIFNLYPDVKKVLYLDPDTKVFSPLEEILAELDQHEIALTPHLTTPEETLEAIWDNEVCALRHGAYNLGFLALSRGEESKKFCTWWASRLYSLCYADYANGLFTDQKWIDLAPCFFNVKVFKHPGYNVAPWNLSQRKLARDSAGNLTSNDLPLRFFHFTGLDSGANEVMTKKYMKESASTVLPLREEYLAECEENGQQTYGKTPWTYGHYNNGEKIPNQVRYQFRQDGGIFVGNPYDGKLVANHKPGLIKNTWRMLPLGFRTKVHELKNNFL